MNINKHKIVIRKERKRNINKDRITTVKTAKPVKKTTFHSRARPRRNNFIRIS